MRTVLWLSVQVIAVAGVSCSTGSCERGQQVADGEVERVFVVKGIGVERGEAKDAIIERLGMPDWQGSGVNTIRYYDRENGVIFALDFDEQSRLNDVQSIEADDFPQSPVVPEEGKSHKLNEVGED